MMDEFQRSLGNLAAGLVHSYNGPKKEIGMVGKVGVSTNSVFISYSNKDRGFVERLAADLRNRGLYVWCDRWELKVGDSLIEKINAGITSQDYLIIVLSETSVRSQWVMRELNAALMRELKERRVVVLPILIEDCDIPPLLSDKVYADFRGDYSLGLNRLLGRFPGQLFPSGVNMRTSRSLSNNVSLANVSRANISDVTGRLDELK